MRITEHHADVVLEFDLERFEEGVEGFTRGIRPTENQFAALVCFAFNVGLTSLANSTLLKKVMRGDTQGAADEFPRWAKAAGKVLQGLVDRRAAERALFLTPAGV
jgi:lysozyme